MLKIIKLEKKFRLPIEDIEIIKKLFFLHKDKSNLKKNEFYSLNDINLEINSGEKVFIIGPSGSGKTTLFSILSDKINFDNGSIKKSNNLFSSTLINLPPNLFPGLKLKNYIRTILSFTTRNQKFSSKKIVNEIIKLLNLTKEDLNRNFYEKDKSIYKLIVLAISCFENNKLYLFDNFNFNFKEEIFKNIWSLFKTNNRNKIQIIFSCNNVDFIKTNADKVLVLENGKIKKFDFIENFNDDELRNFINNNQDDDLIEDDEY